MRWIVSFLSVIVCGGVVSAAVETTKWSQGEPYRVSVEERLNVQQSRLADIERVAEGKRRAVRLTYDRRIEAAQYELAAYLDELDEALDYLPVNDRKLLGMLVRNFANVAEIDIVMRADHYFAEQTGQLSGRIVAGHLVVPIIEKYASDYTDMHPLAFAIVSRVEELVSDVVALRAKKQRSLAGVDTWEKRTSAQVQDTMESIEATTAESAQGVVRATLCESNNECVAMVDGDLVREGQTVAGVKVVEISANGASFEKNGIRWQQETGAPASENWQ